ncbi:MAG: DUF4230 domain-containing protein [Oscillospiraceae bacterium]|nr:DUF4230 domain-containing protein [Oscillospiraceae bacterium]
MKKVISIILLATMILCMCACKKDTKKELREEDIRAICELATLECYYNNVAKINKEADNLFQKDRKLWIEYEGKATLGIKMSDVDIQINGTIVNITLPKAEILSTDYTIFEESYIVSNDRWLFKNEISAEEQTEAVVAAQEEMKREINENKALRIKAEDRAKELIENYIIQIGDVIDKEYTIEWKIR